MYFSIVISYIQENVEHSEQVTKFPTLSHPSAVPVLCLFVHGRELSALQYFISDPFLLSGLVSFTSSNIFLLSITTYYITPPVLRSGNWGTITLTAGMFHLETICV